MIKIHYYRHKINHQAVCEVPDGSEYARFTKWTQKNTTKKREWKGKHEDPKCLNTFMYVLSEEFTFKDITDDFFESFEEVTISEFNSIWITGQQQKFVCNCKFCIKQKQAS